MSGEPASSRLADHFVRVIYPFKHRLRTDRGGEALVHLGNRWHPWWRRLEEGKTESEASEGFYRAVDDTYFFRPFLRGLLFPETRLLPVAEVRDQAELARSWAKIAPSDLLDQVATKSGEGEQECVIRLTLDRKLLGELATMQLDRRGMSVTLSTDWIDAILFPQGVGALVWQFQVVDPDLHSARLREVLRSIRWLHAPTLTWPLGVLVPNQGARVTARDMVDYLVQGLTSVDDKMDESLTEFSARYGQITRPDLYTAGDDGQSFGERFHLFTYAAHVDHGSPAGRFESWTERLSYEFSVCSNPDDPEYAPHDQRLRQLRENHQIALWATWQAMSVGDNIAFVGRISPEEFEQIRADPPLAAPFVTTHLRHNIGSDYFQLYLLNLYQNIWCNSMFGEMLMVKRDPERNMEAVLRLTQRFVDFENQYWYAENTSVGQGRAIDRKIREVMGTAQLLQELREQMARLRDHLGGVVSRWNQQLLSWIAILGIPIGIVFNIFESDLNRDATTMLTPKFLAWLAGSIGVSYLLVQLWRKSQTLAESWRSR